MTDYHDETSAKRILAMFDLMKSLETVFENSIYPESIIVGSLLRAIAANVDGPLRAEVIANAELFETNILPSEIH